MATRRMTIEQACAILSKDSKNKGSTDASKCRNLLMFATDLKQTDALKLLNNYKAIENYLNTKKGRTPNGLLADNSKKSYYSNLKTYADAIKCKPEAIKFYTEQMERYKKLAEAEDDLSKVPEKFNGKLPTIDEMKAVLDKFTARQKNSAAHLLVAFYTLIPPRRLEYRKVIYLDKKPNTAPIVKPAKAEGDRTAAGVPYCYIYPQGSKYVMVLGDYKTDKDYGVYETELPAELSAIISAYIKKAKITNDKYLFATTYGNPFSSGSFSKKLTAAFAGKYPVSITLDDLRHIYATGLDSATTSFARRKEIASAMSHSVEMQLRYVKNNAGENQPAPEPAPQGDQQEEQQQEAEPEEQQEEAPAHEEPAPDNNDDVESVEIVENITKADVLVQMHRYYKLKADYMAKKIALLDKMI